MKRGEIKNPALARTILMGLSLECPMGDVEADCPMRNTRSLGYLKKAGWVKALSDHDSLKIYRLHCTCLEERERELEGDDEKDNEELALELEQVMTKGGLQA